MTRVTALAHRPVAGLVAFAALVAGCGYSSERLVAAPGVASVAVLEFDNQTYRRDLEFRLTRSVAEEVRARTSWRIESPGRADALLSGTIRSTDVRVLELDTNVDPIIERFHMVVDAKLVDRATGRVLREWTVADREEFTPGRFQESLETTATDRLSRRLAEEIVNGMRRPIGDPEAAPPYEPKRARRTGE